VLGSVIDESRAVRETVLGSVVDEARTVKEAVVGSVVDESRAVRETVVGSVIDESRAIKEEARAARVATESEMADLRADVGNLTSEVEGLRSDLVELNRVLRMQGDAADQVAEVLGRTLTRLSAEVEVLSGALESARSLAEGSTSGPPGTAL
jgi:chromosome segregation ATPase